MENIDRKKICFLVLPILIAALATFLLLSLTSASSTVATGLAQAGDVPCLSTSSTIEDLVSCTLGYMPHRYSVDDRDGFTVPTAIEMTQWGEVVEQMMDGGCSAISLSGYEWGNDFTVTTFTDTQNGQAYCVFIETRYDTYPAGERVTRGWGTFIYNPNYCRELNISAPHAKFETDTGTQAAGIFKNTQSRTFLMTGAHRRANNVLSTCQPTACEGNCMESDAAHNTDHMFYATVAELEEYYDSHNTKFYHLQFHGMKSTEPPSCPGVDVYMTHGVSATPVAGDKILALKSNLESRHDWTVTVPGDSPSCNLTGTTNVQGRLLNNVASTEICTTPASSYSGQFIHIEQKSWCRDPDDWVDAINDTWTSHLTVTKQASSNPVSAGARLIYTLTVTNDGDSCATGIIITDTLPANTQFDSASDNGYENQGIVTWTNLAMAQNASLPITFAVRISSCETGLPIINDSYRVVTSTQGITSGWGTPVTTMITTPTINVSFSPAYICPCPNRPVTFNDTSTTNGGPIVAWRWDFGDGSSATSSTVSHSYATSGTYTVTLKVTDSCGFSRTKVVAGAVKVSCCICLPVVMKNYTAPTSTP